HEQNCRRNRLCTTRMGIAPDGERAAYTLSSKPGHRMEGGRRRSGSVRHRESKRMKYEMWIPAIVALAAGVVVSMAQSPPKRYGLGQPAPADLIDAWAGRSEEHTSELQ